MNVLLFDFDHPQFASPYFISPKLPIDSHNAGLSGWILGALILANVCLRNGPHSIRGIRDNRIDVVDSLGETIPVPTLFCVTWEVCVFQSVDA
jgi:hypothetical protein